MYKHPNIVQYSLFTSESIQITLHVFFFPYFQALCSHKENTVATIIMCGILKLPIIKENGTNTKNNCFYLFNYIVLFSTGIKMEGPEVTFMFQFGVLRDAVSVAASSLNLKSLKDLACDFIHSKVS